MLLRGYRDANSALKDMNAQLERRVAERTRDLEKRAQDLAKSNAELDRFASLASHDLQEPLRLVGLYASRLEYQYRDSLDPEIRESVERIMLGVSRTRERIKALLEYSRLRGTDPKSEPVQAENAFKEALRHLKPQIDASGALVSAEGALPTVKMRPPALVTLFENLIDNAIKFHGSTKPEVKINAAVAEGKAVFSIRDNGIGISPAYWQKIFVIFQRLHGEDEYPGLGAGLAICKRLAEHFGGEVWVEYSEPGKGSTFCFELPAAA
jgi:light-regulated signal transduction histidine kinase (bacteriophytochrome)